MEDRLPVRDAAVDPEGDGLELGADAVAGVGARRDLGRPGAHDVAAAVADVVPARDLKERVRGGLGVKGRVERALVEIVPGEIASLLAEVLAVEGPVEPPGRPGRRAEGGRPGRVVDVGLDEGVDLLGQRLERLGVAVGRRGVPERGDGDEVLRAEDRSRSAAAEIPVIVSGQAGEGDLVPPGRPQAHRRRAGVWPTGNP